MQLINHLLNIIRQNSSSVLLLGANFFAMGAGILAVLLLAASMGAKEYGIYVFAVSGIFILTIPFSFGLPTFIMREIAISRTQNDKNNIVSLVAWVTVVFLTVGILATFVLMILDTFSIVEAGEIIWLCLLLSIIISLLQISTGIVRGFDAPFLGQAPISVLRPGVFLALILIVTTFVSPQTELVLTLYISAAGIALMASLLTAAAFLRASMYAVNITKLKFNSIHWGKATFSLGILGAASMLNSYADLFLLGLYSAPEHVANYGVAVQIAGLAIVGQTVANAVIAPRIAAAHSLSDSTQTALLLSTSCRLSIAWSTLCLGLVAILGEPVIREVLGSEFEDAYLLAVALTIGASIVTSVAPATIGLSMMGHETFVSKIVAIGAGINVALNVCFIPLLGPWGAVVTTLIANTGVQYTCAIKLAQVSGTRFGALKLMPTS